MKQWQGFVSEHMQTNVIDENTVRVFNSSWIPETGEWFDDVVRREDTGRYTIMSVNQFTGVLNSIEEFDSIKDYLGY